MSTMLKLDEKKSKGRRRIEIKKIEDKNSRQVTFSKRRSGLFKKASELSILTGAQMAVIVLSAKEKVFACGHPNADIVVDRYLSGKGFSTVSQAPALDYNKVNEEYAEVLEEIAAEKRRSEEISRERKLRGVCVNNESESVFWWTKDVDDMGLMELKNFMESLKELKKNVEMKAHDKAMIMGDYVKEEELNFVYPYGPYGIF